jgi:hypothetical protein
MNSILVIPKALESAIESILGDCVKQLRDEDVEIASSWTPASFEKVVFDKILEVGSKIATNFEAKLISGSSFPDIVMFLEENNKIGVEIKSTKSDSWTCLGNSINESTRVDGIDFIYVFFGKLGGAPDFRYSKYDNVLESIKITHFPRYLINMDCPNEQSIFHKMDIPYNDFRSSPDKFIILKKYYRKNLKDGEELWWLSSSEGEDGVIRLWNEAEDEEKERIISISLVLFPELYHPKSPKKYHRLTSWLVANYKLVSPSLRDNFSAGGKAIIYGYEYPRIAQTLIDNIKSIVKIFESIDREDLCHYWRAPSGALEVPPEQLSAIWMTQVMNQFSHGISADGIKVLELEVSKWLLGDKL